MVHFHNVTKTYPRTHTHALKGVDFRIRKGEFVYITGHSGAGKSTLLSLVLRRIQPTQGGVYILGQDLAKVRESKLPYLRRRIGMVFQDHRLLPNMNALENLVFTLRALGEQQRIAIARALVTNPPLLLSDEPTGNLDPDTSWEILELLNDVNIKGTTVIVATHSRELVERLRRRTLVLRNGELVRDDEKGGYSL